MKLFLLLLLSPSLFAQSEDCLRYEQRIFDSDTCCWRKLLKERLFEQSAKLIVDYLEKGKVENRSSLNWHVGQLFACAQDNRNALKYMRKTYTVFHKWFGGEDGKAWYYFAKGTVAFLERDKPKLERIINRWKTKIPKDNNCKELLSLLQHWEMNYERATATNNSVLPYE